MYENALLQQPWNATTMENLGLLWQYVSANEVPCAVSLLLCWCRCYCVVVAVAVLLSMLLCCAAATLIKLLFMNLRAASSMCNQTIFSSNLLCFALPLIRLSFRYAGHVQNTIKFLSMAVEKALLPAALPLSISHPHLHTVFISSIKSLTPSSNRAATTPTLRSRTLRHIYPAPSLFTLTQVMFNLANNLKASGRNTDAVDMYGVAALLLSARVAPRSHRASCTPSACPWNPTTSCSTSCRQQPWTA